MTISTHSQYIPLWHTLRVETASTGPLRQSMMKECKEQGSSLFQAYWLLLMKAQCSTGTVKKRRENQITT